MGSESSIRLPKSLRDRLNSVIADEQKRTGKRVTQASWIEKRINEAEKQ